MFAISSVDFKNVSVWSLRYMEKDLDQTTRKCPFHNFFFHVAKETFKLLLPWHFLKKPICSLDLYLEKTSASLHSSLFVTERHTSCLFIQPKVATSQPWLNIQANYHMTWSFCNFLHDPRYKLYAVAHDQLIDNTVVFYIISKNSLQAGLCQV